MPESEYTVAGWPRVFHWCPVPDQNGGTEWYRFTLPLKTAFSLISEANISCMRPTVSSWSETVPSLV